MPRTPRLFYVALAFSASGVWSSSARAQDDAQPSGAPTTQPAPAPSPTTRAPSPRGPLFGPAVGEPSSTGPTIDVRKDQDDLRAQGAQRPAPDGSIAHPGEVFAEDWWANARPILELHGYFRTRGEVFHNFALGRHDAPGDPNSQLWPHPIDQSFDHRTTGQSTSVNLCGPASNQLCHDKTESGANMRLRLNPELHISDNLRIVSQIDALDNLVLGSTPDRTPYSPFGFLSTTQVSPPRSIDVKRVWAEYQTPVGQLRFGRMPDHWGLGMVYNSGDTLDSDYQSTIDRIMFTTGIKSMDLYFGGSWDFVSTGPTSNGAVTMFPEGGQPNNTCNLCNVDQWSLFAARRTNPELQRYKLAHGEAVFNGGVYTKYRKQLLDVQAGNPNVDPLNPSIDQSSPGKFNTDNGLTRRQAWVVVPDLWLQALWGKFRFEAEFASYIGSIDYFATGSSASVAPTSTDVRSYAVSTQTEYRAIEDKLRLQFGFGWASGDSWDRALDPTNAGSVVNNHLNPGANLSTFRFNPDYRVDLIFFRHILSRVEGAYYFRPSVDYDFMRSANGQKLGGGAAIIWSRASEFMQTPGHKRDLGVELDVQLYYQAKDGSFNDDPEKVGGFFAMLQYGVFFPLGGLDYLQGVKNANSALDWDLSTAQTLRLFLGVAF